MYSKLKTIKNIKLKMHWHPIMFYNVKNRVDKEYAYSNIQKILPELKRRIDNKIFLGELGCPNPFNHLEYRITNISNVTHMITDIFNTPKCLYAKIKIMKHDKGNLLRNLLKNKITVFRPRLVEEFKYSSIYFTNVLDIISIDAVPIYEDLFINTQKNHDRKFNK